MESKESARFAADRITEIASNKGISVNKLLANAGLKKSVVDRMKLGSMPSSEKLAAIAAELDVPMEYIVGSGVFAKWDLILEHKGAILSSISSMMGDLSKTLCNGVDNLSLAKLVWAFGVDIDMGSDPSGVEILVTSPFPVYGPEQESLSGSSSNTGSPETKKEPTQEMTPDELEMLELFRTLPYREQQRAIGRLQTLVEVSKEEGPKKATGAQPSGGKAV